ncbi:PAS domain S-box protein [Sphingomonas faeni]|uniref:PAS domain S-box protein n=1 Tax=Sphingomonas faeni TaxID=185950 RepID=UPI00334746FC
MQGVILDFDEGFCQLVQRRSRELIGLSYKAITCSADLRKSSKMLSGLVDKAAPTHIRKAYVRPDSSLIKADLIVSKFSHEGRLIASLSWVEDPQQASPSKIWKAALQIKHIYELRIIELGRDLFSDHVGLILVHIYLAEAEGRVAAVGQIARSIDLPVQTMDRWVKVLVLRGLIETLDHAAEYIQLSHNGASRLERLFSATLAPETFAVGRV